MSDQVGASASPASATRASLNDPREPFAKFNLVLFLEPRDLPWWPVSHARGRRDTVIVRGALRIAPRVELEALDPGSWSGRETLRRLPQGWLSRDAEGREPLAIHGADAEALARGRKLAALARDMGLVVRRLSVRRADPYFQVHLAWPDAGGSAAALFDAVARLALVVSEEHDRTP